MDNRCYKCKKYCLVTIKCKCENTYCMYHRLPEKHECGRIYEFVKISRDRNEEQLNRHATGLPQKFVKLE